MISPSNAGGSGPFPNTDAYQGIKVVDSRESQFSTSA